MEEELSMWGGTYYRTKFPISFFFFQFLSLIQISHLPGYISRADSSLLREDLDSLILLALAYIFLYFFPFSTCVVV